MIRIVCYVAFSFIISFAAYADDNTPAPAVMTIKARIFNFASGDTSAQSRDDSYCLSPGEQLIKIVGVDTLLSNSSSVVDVKGDLEKNCIYVKTNIPGASQVCTSEGQITITGDSQKTCSIIPSVLNISVRYQSKIVIRIYPRASFDTDIYKHQVTVLKNVLAFPQYAISAPVFVGQNIEKNEIKFCDPANLVDAKTLQTYLESVHYNPFTVTNLAGCASPQTHNTLEVWLNAARTPG